jgi:hypothetical protein
MIVDEWCTCFAFVFSVFSLLEACFFVFKDEFF